MTVSINESAFVGVGGQKVSLSSMFSVSAGTNDPTYLVLTGLDRNEYAVNASGATGTLSGNGASDSFSNIGGDGRGIGVIFTYQASSGRYFSSTYGYLDQMTYTASTSVGDVTNLSLYATNNLGQASTNANNAYSMVQLDPSGYIGSVTVATQPSFTGAVPTQATPDSICATAASFVGKAWNLNGCWVLASTIAAESGASLPVDSAMVGIGGHANGEWIVAFNGSTQSGNWESLVKAGEMIVIGNGSSGHITTCVAGSGSTSMLIDNVTYVNASGTIVNTANDGSSNDITISAAHPASQEWTGVVSSDVVIYELDAPIVSTLVTSDNLTSGGKQSLAQLFSATDPVGKALTEYQVYNTANNDSLTVNGANETAHSAASAITVSSLSSISLQAGSTTGTDSIDVRAFNGNYWGDWETLQVSIGGTGTAPYIVNQTATQRWTQGEHVSFVLPGNTFIDPNGESLKLSASLGNGQALPSWLNFVAATGTFSGIVPDGTANLTLKVTATDTSGLSVADTFAVNVAAGPLALAAQTANQVWTDGKKVSLTLPADTFIDPQGLHITYAAYEVGGTPVTSWLTFNAVTETFSGQLPNTAKGVAYLEVVATDTSGASATDMFAVSFGQSATTASLVGVRMQTSHGIELIHG